MKLFNAEELRQIIPEELFWLCFPVVVSPEKNRPHNNDDELAYVGFWKASTPTCPTL